MENLSVNNRKKKTNVSEIAKLAKQDSFELACIPGYQRNTALGSMGAALNAFKKQIAEANAEDMARAEENGIPEPLKKRLLFDEKKLQDAIEGLYSLEKLEDPIGKVTLHRELDEGLTLKRVSCPIGVIGVIFEARPDALIQISALCLKSGNAAILKGGSEATETNKLLADLLHRAGTGAGLPYHFLNLLESREETTEMLACHESIDLIIPRGSNEFVRYIMDNSKIPVMGHSDGVCHIYVDKDADIEKTVPIIVDAKTQYPAACNAAETILVHQDIAKKLLPVLKNALDEKGVEVNEGAYGKEYLDLALSLNTVEDIDEAIDHINTYGSHHTDAIITENSDAAAHFFAAVDSAGVYRNCSTRFADGFRYGFGAEVGISTGKLHARGPVGLDGLVTYKYELVGDGHIVADYANGTRTFHFRDI